MSEQQYDQIDFVQVTQHDEIERLTTELAQARAEVAELKGFNEILQKRVAYYRHLLMPWEDEEDESAALASGEAT